MNKTNKYPSMLFTLLLSCTNLIGMNFQNDFIAQEQQNNQDLKELNKQQEKKIKKIKKIREELQKKVEEQKAEYKQLKNQQIQCMQQALENYQNMVLNTKTN